jgi:hypothetical protein
LSLSSAPGPRPAARRAKCEAGLLLGEFLQLLQGGCVIDIGVSRTANPGERDGNTRVQTVVECFEEVVIDDRLAQFAADDDESLGTGGKGDLRRVCVFLGRECSAALRTSAASAIRLTERRSLASLLGRQRRVHAGASGAARAAGWVAHAVGRL